MTKNPHITFDEQTTLEEFDNGVNYLIWIDEKWFKKDGFNFAKTVFRVRKWVHTIHHVLNGKLIETTYRED